MKKLIWLALFLLPFSSVLAFPITAQSWLVATGDGKIIDGSNTKDTRSIASISKLVTAMIVLDAKQDLNEHLQTNTRSDLIQLALVKSDNTAAKQLCDHYPGGYHECVFAMNRKMYMLGLLNTKFNDPTGLSVFNVSTAEELITVVLEAQKYPEIVQASKSSQVKVKIRKKWFVFNNTNPIIGKRHEFIVSKTGYIRASGGCIVMMLDTDVGRRIVVVLGSKNTHTRIPEAEFIANSR
jgi:serine-type D-Ala-D-Ala endopeptidase (penicillin-binding protein 7)